MKAYKRIKAAVDATQPGNVVLEIGFGKDRLYIANVNPDRSIDVIVPYGGALPIAGTVVVKHLAMGNHNHCNVTKEGRDKLDSWATGGDSFNRARAMVNGRSMFRKAS